MKKLLSILKLKKGMTMIELVVGMLIFAVIASSVAAVLVPTLNAYMKANELAEVNTLLDNLSEEMLSDIARATAVSVDDVAGNGKITIITGIGNIDYYVDTGVLCRAGGAGDVPVLEKRYYKGKSVAIDYLGQDGITEVDTADEIKTPFYIRLTISSDKGGSIASRRYAANPVGFKNYRE